MQITLIATGFSDTAVFQHEDIFADLPESVFTDNTAKTQENPLDDSFREAMRILNRREK
jgi:hypothetical protein